MEKRTISHWDKYPCWTPERRYLACYLTFGESSVIVEAAQTVQADLHQAPVACCPPESLHQTMPGVATRDELSDAEVENIRNSIRAAIREYPAFELSIDGFEADIEGMFLITKPRASLESLHAVLHKAISDGWGRSADGEAGDVYPHITIAYANAVGDASPLMAAAEKHKELQGRTRVAHVDLVWLRREPGRYAWDLVERFPLQE